MRGHLQDRLSIENPIENKTSDSPVGVSCFFLVGEVERLQKFIAFHRCAVTELLFSSALAVISCEKTYHTCTGRQSDRRAGLYEGTWV